MKPRISRPSRTAALALATLCLSSAMASAVVTLSDPFTDATRNGGADNSGIAWWDRSANSTLNIGNDATLGTGNALLWAATNTATTNRGIVGTFSQAFNLSVGDSISMTFDFRLATTSIAAGGSTTTPGNSTQGLTFGFYNSNGTAVAADDSTASDNDFGYHGGVGSGTANGNAIVQEGNVGGGGLGTTTAGDTPNTVFTLSTNAATAINDFNKHTGEFTIVISGAGIATITTKIDGVTIAEGSNGSAYTSFDEVVFSQGGGNSFRLDNVVVTTTVPEASTAAALLGGLAMMCGIRRRKR